MATMQRVGKCATTVSRHHSGTVHVVYHSTTVVEIFPNGTIILDHGGWKTATTKTKMNQASEQFKLGYKVYQKNGEWFVTFRGATIPFGDRPLVLK